MKKIFVLSSVVIAMLGSCIDEQKPRIKVINSQIDTTNGLAVFNIYASDTAWEDMKVYGDSIFSLNKGKAYSILLFCYPEHSIPDFGENFTVKKTSDEPNFVIGEYYDTSLIHKPVLVKYPNRYVEAKKHEKDNPRETK